MGRPRLEVISGYKPHDAVILGLDPATKSGWAIFRRGSFVDSGVAKSPSDRAQVLDLSITIGEEEDIPLVVVAEQWTPGNWKSWRAIAGVHEAWGRWSEQIELLRIDRVVRVPVQTWRKDLYGSRMKKNLSRETAKNLAKTRVKSVYRIQVNDDEAEAILIAEWGSRSSEVGKILER